MTAWHPTPSEIEQWVIGATDETELPEIEAHFLACDTCAEELRTQAWLDTALGEVATESRFCPECGCLVPETRCTNCDAPLQVGGYRVETVIADAPQGRVYLVRDPNGQRAVLKELVFSQVPDTLTITKFEREAGLLRQLRHPGIPRFLGSFREEGEDQTRFYLVQEYLEGETLLSVLESRRFREKEVIAIARKALEILVYLHGLSPAIYHRDIQPGNLLLRPDGSVVLINFGSARDLALTGTFTVVGTFGYVPTEQLAGIVDQTSDLYGLGASIIHLLTRDSPWREGSKQILERANVSDRLKKFLEKMTAESADQRFRSAVEALRALEDVIHPPRRTPPVERTWPVAATWIAGIALGAAAVTGLYELGSLGQSSTSVHEQPVPKFRTGSITIESVPQGATIFLDGKTMPLANGVAARTPSDLHSLQYGTTYHLRFEREGFEPHEMHVAMDRSYDGRSLRPRLTRLSGNLIVEVRGNASKTRILLNGEVVGSGPLWSRDLPTGHFELSVEADDGTCGDRAGASVIPGASTRVVFQCTKRRSAPVVPKPKKTSAGCRPDLKSAAGYLTFSTEPASTVFLGDKVLGVTPLSKVKLSAGCHEIRAVSLDGRMSKTTKIKVKSNQVMIYKVVLDR